MLTLSLVGTRRIDIDSIFRGSPGHSNKPMTGPRLSKARDFGIRVLRTDAVARHSRGPWNLRKKKPLYAYNIKLVNGFSVFTTNIGNKLNKKHIIYYTEKWFTKKTGTRVRRLSVDAHSTVFAWTRVALVDFVLASPSSPPWNQNVP